MLYNSCLVFFCLKSGNSNSNLLQYLEKKSDQEGKGETVKLVALWGI